MADEEVIADEQPEKPVDPDNNWKFPADEAKQEELPLAAEAEEKPEEVKAEEAKPEPVLPPEFQWMKKELNSKHKKNKEYEQKLAEKEAELAAKDALLAKFNQSKPEETQTIPIDEVDRKAREIVAQERYVESCNTADTKGKETYKEAWGEAVANLTILGGFDEHTMNGILATDDPSKVIYELGKNPDKYHSLMALPLERRIIEMGKISMAQSSGKPVSSAPAPVNPVGGRAAPARETLTDNMDDDKWYSIRQAQKRKRFEERNGIRR